MIQAVLFDLDDTLHDRQRTLQHFLQWQYDKHASSWGTFSKETFMQQFAAYDKGGMVWKDQVYRQLKEELHVSEHPDVLLEEYVEHVADHAVWMEGAEEALAACRRKGLKTGLITNGKRTLQRRVIGALQLEARMDVILISEEEDIRKPQADIFLRAADQLELEPEACLFIGDSLEADARGAASAGMRSLWLHGEMNCGARVLPAYEQLISYLEEEM
ncbi:HAD family hydrolase [Alkalicoccus luteus]|uniref:HAD family hydrolase n=1 Tax=Alkalicoccus luteus TaxID=1237094 RepID=UPI0040331B06